jgi:replication fork clamp-binding protein CrfC
MDQNKISDLQEKLHDLQQEFSDNVEVQDLILKLREKFNELQEKRFSGDDFALEEFDEMNEQYWSVCKESDVDEIDLFTFLWFN